MTKPYVVIIAGGSGTRLWPLSTQKTPKHLLALTGKRSLLQSTVDRAYKLTDPDKIWIVPEKSHADQVYEQVPEISKQQILVEPGRRGTTSCALLALAEISRRHLPDAPVLILWADHLIRDLDGFCTTLKTASGLSEQTHKLVFVGVEPTYPATGFNYIRKGKKKKTGSTVFALDSFVEKPDQPTADVYFESGEYFWNAGYLIGLHSVFLSELHRANPQRYADFEILAQAGDHTKEYLSFSNEPIDTALSERVKDALVVSADFDWADVGSFRDYYDVSLKDEDSNLVLGQNIHVVDLTNSLLRNETSLPVAVIGLDNVVVVVTEDGVAVMNKNFSQKIGDVAKKLQSNNPKAGVP